MASKDTVWRDNAGRPEKRCPTCAGRGRDPWHPYDAYASDPRRKHGLDIRCLLCRREDTRAWAEKYPDRYAAHVARAIRWKRAHSDWTRAAARRYYERHKAARKATRRQSRPTRWTPELRTELRTQILEGGRGTANRLARRLGISRQRISQLKAPDAPPDND